MDYWRNQLIEIDDCLYNFNVHNFYDAAISLFKTLEFPVNELEEDTRNLSIEELLKKQGLSEDFINPSEKLAISLIEKVSILFVLNSQTKGLEYVEEYNDGIYVGESIIIIGVDLFISDYFYDEYYDNHYIIPAITTFFNRLINTQILILFKRGSKIAFSVKRRRFNKIDNTRDAKGSNFQTEWMETYPPGEETKFRLLEFSFENFRDFNFYFMYNDMVKSIATRYLVEDFPENDNIVSHINITDEGALYFRDYKNLTFYIFNFKPSTDDREDDAQEDIEYSNERMNIFDNSRDETAITRESSLVAEHENILTESIELSQMDEIDNISQKEIDLCNNTSDSINNQLIEEIDNSQDGDQTMDGIIKDIIGDFSNLKTNFNRLSDYFNDLRKDDEHLSLKESEELSNYCFKKMKEINIFKSDVDLLWDRFTCMVQEEEQNEVDEDGKKKSESTIYQSNNDSNINGELQSYSFTSPYKITLLNKDYSVKNWTDVLITISEALIKIYPEQISALDKNPLLRGRSRQYFSYDKELLTEQAKELSNGLYVETNFSSDHIVRISRTILEICGVGRSQLSFYVNQTRNVETLTIGYDSNINEDSGLEIKFTQKYCSISVSADLIKIILRAMLDHHKKDFPYIEMSRLKDELTDIIQAKSSYKQPQHVLNNIKDFLMDWEVIALYEGSKRGKYIIKDQSILEEMASDPKTIFELLKNE